MTKETKFTPAPWAITGESNTKAIMIGQDSGRPVALVHTTCDDIQANAHLIAVSPEMYEVLSLVPKMLSHAYSTAINDERKTGKGDDMATESAAFEKRVRDLLAKARGEHEQS